MRKVLVPAAAGVLSALGLVGADERRDTVRSLVVPLTDAGPLPGRGEADVRYAGQAFELTVQLGGDTAARFHDAHQERYGWADPGRPLELVAIRTAEVTPGPRVALTGPAHTVRGPALLELEGATCRVPSGWAGETDAHGTLVLERG